MKKGFTFRRRDFVCESILYKRLYINVVSSWQTQSLIIQGVINVEDVVYNVKKKFHV